MGKLYYYQAHNRGATISKKGYSETAERRTERKNWYVSLKEQARNVLANPAVYGAMVTSANEHSRIATIVSDSGCELHISSYDDLLVVESAHSFGDSTKSIKAEFFHGNDGCTSTFTRETFDGTSFSTNTVPLREHVQYSQQLVRQIGSAMCTLARG